MLKIKDIIEKLQELNDDDVDISIKTEPIIERYENCNGDGWETIKYEREILITDKKEKIRKYKNKGGIKVFWDEKIEN